MPPPTPTRLGGAFAIAHERQRQIEGEGFDQAHDAEHSPSTLLAAAACYLNHAGLQLEGLGLGRAAPPEHWPWHGSWWKPSVDPSVNLVKGGALVAAALDRFWNIAPDFRPFQIVKKDEGYRPSDIEIMAWADRNGLDASVSAIRTAIDDARSMHRLRDGKTLEQRIDSFVDSMTPNQLALKMQEYGMRFRNPPTPEPAAPELDRVRYLLETARKFALKHPDTLIHYDEADCDGQCLADDIKTILDHGV